MKYFVALGRVLYSMIFLVSAMFHFTAQGVMYASAQGVLLPMITVPLSGIMAILGGISVALGYRTKWGALMLILFLATVTIMMHNFWAVTDPMMSQMQFAMFMKNLALLGSALLIAYFGAGPLSFDARAKAAKPQLTHHEGHRTAA
jgi:putative oxidoreductase